MRVFHCHKENFLAEVLRLNKAGYRVVSAIESFAYPGFIILECKANEVSSAD